MGAVPGKATYWAYMVEWAGYVNGWLQANNNPENDGGLAQVYYDGEVAAYRIADYTGNAAAWESFIQRTFDAYVTYYVLPNSGSVQGFRNFTGGQLEDVLRGTSRSANALLSIQQQLANGAYVATGDCSSTDLSRECAYAIITHINALRAGITLSAGQYARLDQLIAWSQGHCLLWSTDSTDYFRPFMGGLTAYGLITAFSYYNPDPTTITRLTDLADYAWATCWKGTAGAWGQANSFLYTDRDTGNPDDLFVQPDLNMIIAPWWGWLYFVGAGATYRTNGDLIFQGGLPVYNGPFHDSGTYLGTRSSINPSGKQYNQQLFWGPLYISYAEAGDGAGTSYVSANALGDWDTATDWTPNGVPGIGDTAIIQAGHTMVVSGNSQIGESAAMGNVVLSIETTATLSIVGSLTLRGDISVEGTGKIVNEAGSGFIFDSTLSSSPLTNNYKVDLGNAHGNNCYWEMNGTALSPVSISSNPLGANGYIDGQYTQSGLIHATYTNFTNLGTATIPFVTTNPTGTTEFSLVNCNINSCGRISRVFNVGEQATYIIAHTSIVNCLDSGGLAVELNTNAALTTGERTMIFNVIDGAMNLYPGENFTIEDNVLLGPVNTTDGDWDSFARNFVVFTSDNPGPMNAAGDMTDCYFYYDNPTDYNPHFIQPLGYDRDQTFDGLIFDMNCDVNSPAQEGDCFTFATPGGVPCTATITRCIAVVGPNNKTVGTMFTMLGNINTNVNATHNTCYAGGQGAAVQEGYGGHLGQVVAFKSNLVFSLTPNNGYLLYGVTNSGVVDVAAAADVTNNGGINLSTGTNGYGYNNMTLSSGSLGANDLYEDPQFADYTRNLRTWDLTQGGDGTDTDAYEKLIANPSLIADLVDYIRDGFTPTNVNYETAGHDGTTIGAVEYQEVSASMYVTPVTMVANTTGNVLTVTGVATNWTAGTPGSPTFTISGVTGAAITSQVVNSPTSATLTVTASTGGAIGVATISDGTIDAPVITVTPPTPDPGTPGQNARRRAW